jgi:hypothetical protein
MGRKKKGERDCRFGSSRYQPEPVRITVKKEYQSVGCSPALHSRLVSADSDSKGCGTSFYISCFADSPSAVPGNFLFPSSTMDGTVGNSPSRQYTVATFHDTST